MSNKVVPSSGGRRSRRGRPSSEPESGGVKQPSRFEIGPRRFEHVPGPGIMGPTKPAWLSQITGTITAVKSDRASVLSRPYPVRRSDKVRRAQVVMMLEFELKVAARPDEIKPGIEVACTVLWARGTGARVVRVAPVGMKEKRLSLLEACRIAGLSPYKLGLTAPERSGAPLIKAAKEEGKQRKNKLDYDYSISDVTIVRSVVRARPKAGMKKAAPTRKKEFTRIPVENLKRLDIRQRTAKEAHDLGVSMSSHQRKEEFQKLEGALIQHKSDVKTGRRKLISSEEMRPVFSSLLASVDKFLQTLQIK